MSISISSRKAKSRNLQNAIAQSLLKKFPQFDSNDIKPAIMGQSGIDIHLSNPVRKLFPFAIECKNQESLSIWAALEQCEENGRLEKLTPMLIFKRNRSDIYVTLKFEDFIKLV
jgi:hypothetical protein